MTVPPGNSGFLLINDYCNFSPRLWHRIYNDCFPVALRKYSQHLVSLWLGVQTDIITVSPGNSGFLLIENNRNRPISQIPQCISQISHNAPFCNRNVHTCAHFCYKMVHCGIWDWCIVGFVQQVYCCPRVWHRIYSDCSLIALRKYSQHLVSLWLGVQTDTVTVRPGNSAGLLLIKDCSNCSPRVWHRILRHRLILSLYPRRTTGFYL